VSRAVDVHIRMLLVRGTRVPNAHRLGPAVAAELERLLAAGAPPHPAPSPPVGGPAAPERLAPGIAAAVHRELVAREAGP
jgi:hypothetical protein